MSAPTHRWGFSTENHFCDYLPEYNNIWNVKLNLWLNQHFQPLGAHSLTHHQTCIRFMTQCLVFRVPCPSFSIACKWLMGCNDIALLTPGATQSFTFTALIFTHSYTYSSIHTPTAVSAMQGSSQVVRSRGNSKSQGSNQQPSGWLSTSWANATN